jgi:hypothetical protein
VNITGLAYKPRRVIDEIILNYDITPEKLYKLVPEDGGHYIIQPDQRLLDQIKSSVRRFMFRNTQAYLIAYASAWPQADQNEAMACYVGNFNANDGTSLYDHMANLACAAVLLVITASVPLPIPPAVPASPTD